MKNTNWSVVPNDKQIVAANIQEHIDGGYTWDEIATVDSEATAALIAAAPDMFGALTELLDADFDGDKNDKQSAIDLARAAIKKARGES